MGGNHQPTAQFTQLPKKNFRENAIPTTQNEENKSIFVISDLTLVIQQTLRIS
jgi:hypothetical protein